MTALKHSKQRELIKAFLMTRKDHPTADVVYTNVRQQNPNISMGTVYRNLTLLAGRFNGSGSVTVWIILMPTPLLIIISSARNAEA